MGKGSKRRPRQVDRKTFDDNWDKIFGKKAEEKIESLELEDNCPKEEGAEVTSYDG